MSDRRSYNPSDYVPPNDQYDDSRARSRDPYREQSRGRDEDSRRYQSRDAAADRRALVPESTYSRGAGSYAGYEEDVYDDRTTYESNAGGRSRSRRAREDSRARSRSRYRSGSRSRSRSREDFARRIKGNFGKEKKDLAATAIGAIAGGFLGHEAGSKHGNIATIGGAVLGGLAANAWEHQHLKRKEQRRLEREVSYEDDYDEKYSQRR